MGLAREDLAGFFIHIDGDCLSDDIMPAVDHHLAGGLSRLDTDGTAGRRLAQLLANVLGTRAPGE